MGAAVDAMDDSEQTPLYKACENGKLEVARLLIMHGADPCLLNDRLPEAIKTFIESDWFDTPLHEVVYMNDIERARALLEAPGGIEVDAVGRRGWTSLHLAFCMGRKIMAELLLDAGADITAVFDEGRYNVLHAAAYKNVSNMTGLCADARIVNACDAGGRTAIEHCAYYGRTVFLETLLLSGADPFLNDCKSLVYAACRGHRGAAQMLITSTSGALSETIFYRQIIVGRDDETPFNRRAVLVACRDGFSECFLALLAIDVKDEINAERSTWKAIDSYLAHANIIV